MEQASNSMTLMPLSGNTWRAKGKGRKPKQHVDEGRHTVSVKASSKPFRPHHAMTVPRNQNLSCYHTPVNSFMTTAMLRNIPNKYTQTSLMKEIDCMNFVGTYDFFYLPMDTHNQTNVGYAFVNFIDPQDMTRFAQVFTGHVFRLHPSQKIGRVSPAHLQGFADNVLQYANCAVSHSHKNQYRPIVVYQGVRRDIAEVAAELLWAQHSSYVAPEMLLPPPGLSMDMMPVSGLDPQAEEFVPASASHVASAAPMNMKCSFEAPSSFSIAKEELEGAVLRWLRDGSSAPANREEPVPAEKWLLNRCESTEGGSGTQSGTATPKSDVVDFEAGKDLQDMAPGTYTSVINDETADCNSPTPRSHRTLLNHI